MNFFDWETGEHTWHVAARASVELLWQCDLPFAFGGLAAGEPSDAGCFMVRHVRAARCELLPDTGPAALERGVPLPLCDALTFRPMNMFPGMTLIACFENVTDGQALLRVRVKNWRDAASLTRPATHHELVDWRLDGDKVRLAGLVPHYAHPEPSGEGPLDREAARRRRRR